MNEAPPQTAQKARPAAAGGSRQAAEETELRQIRRRAQIQCPGGGVHSSPEMELTKIPDTSKYEQHRERFPRMQVKGPAGSR